MRTVLLVTLVTGIAAVGSASAAFAQESNVNDRSATLRIFHERVEAYVNLHRRLEAPLPPMTGEARTTSMLLAKRYLASAIRTARSTARPGDIFDRVVAGAFREIIAEGLSGGEVEPLSEETNHPDGQRLAVGFGVPVVNEPYPKAGMRAVPAAVLQRLPLLQEDLQYRVAGRDLLLWDAHADIVVDVLTDALPPFPITP